MSVKLVDAALAYLARGWVVFPCRDKHTPLVPWGQYRTERPTPEEVASWWVKYPNAWPAIVLGKSSGVVRMDADGEGKVKAAGYGLNGSGFTSPSGGRGWLLPYQDWMEVLGSAHILWRGEGDHQELRFQGDGAYTVLPGPPGYTWDGAEWTVEPSWDLFYDLRAAASGKSLDELVRELSPTIVLPGKELILEALVHLAIWRADDRKVWLQVGFALHSAGDEYLPAWIEWSRQSKKFKEGECERLWAKFDRRGRTTIKSILWMARKDGWAKSIHEPMTDIGNAHILVQRAEDRIKYSSEWGWMAWANSRWVGRKEAELVVQEEQKASIRDRTERAHESFCRCIRARPDDQKAWTRKYKTWRAALAHQSHGKVQGAIDEASSDPRLAVDHRHFDQHPFLFNCPNGTVELTTGERREHRREDLLTQLCPTEYHPDAECPMWAKFLEDILPREDVRKFLGQILGSCLSGDTSAQMLFVFWGCGANGKSTLIETVMQTLGQDYAMKAKRDLLLVKRSSEHPTSIARLRSKRLVTCVESGEGGRLDETLVKEITGGDTMAARRMREDEWEFLPTFKPILATNHKPVIRGVDDGIWRRMQLVPFTQQFMKDDPRCDPLLKDKLKLEAPGILAWLVRQGVEWYAGGRKYDVPEEVKVATSEYRSEQDYYEEFLTECCTFEGEFTVTDITIRKKYTEWATVNRKPALDKDRLNIALRKRGITKGGSGDHTYRGVKLK